MQPGRGVEPVRPPEQAESTPPPVFTVILNEYEPDNWNHGYGHYDLTIASAAGEAFICKLDGERVECRDVTLSYGPLDGDDSPARVHLYTQPRQDHQPQERLVVYENLELADFNRYMRWFMGDFARYEGDAGEFRVFHVREKTFRQYSVAAGNNCITATLRLISALPGVTDPARNSRAAMVERLEMYFAEKLGELGLGRVGTELGDSVP